VLRVAIAELRGRGMRLPEICEALGIPEPECARLVTEPRYGLRAASGEVRE
jgi:DNA-binding IclR family transcriptional regulator